MHVTQTKSVRARNLKLQNKNSIFHSILILYLKKFNKNKKSSNEKYFCKTFRQQSKSKFTFLHSLKGNIRRTSLEIFFKKINKKPKRRTLPWFFCNPMDPLQIFNPTRGTRSFFRKPFFRFFVQNRLTNGLASLFWLFIACLTWPNLTGSNRPLSLFFHHLTLPGYPVFCCLFSEIWKMEIKRSGYQLLNFLLLA